MSQTVGRIHQSKLILLPDIGSALTMAESDSRFSLKAETFSKEKKKFYRPVLRASTFRTRQLRGEGAGVSRDRPGKEPSIVSCEQWSADLPARASSFFETLPPSRYGAFVWLRNSDKAWISRHLFSSFLSLSFRPRNQFALRFRWETQCSSSCWLDFKLGFWKVAIEWATGP